MSNTPPISPRTPLPKTNDAPPMIPTAAANPQYFTPVSPMSFSTTSASSALGPRITSSPEDHSPIAQRALFSEERFLSHPSSPMNNSSSSAQRGIIHPQEAMDLAWELVCKAQSSAIPNYSNYHKALSLAAEGLVSAPNHVGLLTVKAKCHLACANYALASETAMQILQLDPENAEAMVLLCDCDELQSAIPTLQFDRLSISSAPDPEFMKAVELVLSYENLADAKGMAEALFKEAERLLEREPGSATHHATQILCLMVQGNIGRMIEFLEQSSHIEPLFDRMMQTLESAEQVLKKEPHHGTALMLKAACLFCHSQRDQILTSMQQMMSGLHDPRTAKPEDCLMLLTGTHHPSLRDVHEKTLASAERLLERDPHNLMGYAIRAESLRLLGRADDALDMVNFALSRYPEDTFLLTLHALCLIPFHVGKAHHVADQVVSKDPQKNLLAWLVKLQCLFKMGEREQIVQALKHAKECFPTNGLIQGIYKHYVSEST